MLRSKLTGRPAWAGAILVTLLAFSMAFAALNGSMTVTVKDKDGAPIPGATVTVTSPAQLGERSAVTNAEGLVRINALAPGEYKVVVAMQGFAARTLENVPVKLDENRQVSMQLSEEIVEQVTVTSKPPVVDSTSTQISKEIDRNIANNLPIGRDYQTNATRVPGVGTGSNPSVKGGTERDNLYLIDGVNTTDPVTGTFGSNINYEIIDQQSVTTGGHMAEYGGVVGMVSNVVTKSGGNEWSGSANYFRTDSDWSADPKEGATAQPQVLSYDYSFNEGGPIIRDRLWQFASWQKVYSETLTNDIDDPITGEITPRPPREFDGTRPFAKLTWQITPNHRVAAHMNAEDATISNQNASDTRIGIDQLSEQYQRGPTYTAKYTGLFGSNWIVEAQANFYRGKLDAYPEYPELGPNTQTNEVVAKHFGRYSNEQYSKRYRDEYRADATWFKSTSWGDHNVKMGAGYVETEFYSINIASGGERYLDQPHQWLGGGRTFWTATTSMTNRLNRWRGLAEQQGWDCTIAGVDCLGIFSTSGLSTDPSQWQMVIGETTYTPTDFVFGAFSQNPDAAQYNGGTYRFFGYTDVVGDTGSTSQKMWSAFVQDDWTFGKWSVRAGLRLDKQDLYTSLGDKLYGFDTVIGPRLGVTYDPVGDGKSKIFLHAGRLYDPLRDNTTSFAGQLDAPVSDTLIWLDGPEAFADDYYSFFQTGGVGNAQAVISPKVKTPKTDELIIGYSRDLGSEMSIEVDAFYRKTKDITEDFDPIFGLDPDLYGYSSPTVEELGFGDANGDGTINAADISPADYIIYNPPGGKREAKGFDVTFTKRFADKWQAMASYSYLDTEGNVLDDGLYGSVGDDPYLDPRLEWNNGGMSYARDHFIQIMGSYRFDFGLNVGLEYRTYAGQRRSMTVSTDDVSGFWTGDPSQIVDSLHIERETYFPGMTDEEIVAMVPFDLMAGRGAYQAPWFNQLNLRLRQEFPLFWKVRGEFFLDVFNVLNRQKATDKEYGMSISQSALIFPEDPNEEPINGIDQNNIGDTNSYLFGTTTSTQAPRSFTAGVRVSF